MHLSGIDHLEIEPLSDDLLESVAGATSSGSTCCSCQDCSNGGSTKPPVVTSPCTCP
ncbi:hypothetical protein [Longimicrobium sp.]|jgi:hypothetical protein|uniref:hypothetical protein n=1 Tax=Longimicrobium sp. TaxID=2029185 RepID=UPI002EDB3DF6